MTRAKIQAGGQLQLPQEILQAWSLQSNQEIDIRLVDNIVVLMPWSQKTEEDQDIMTYAGIGQGLWGKTPEAIETHIRELRDSWNR